MGKKVKVAKKVFKSNKPSNQTVLSAKEVADRLKKRKAANLIVGAGGASQPKGGPKNIVGRSKEPDMQLAISNKDKDNLAKSNAARGSYKRSLTLEKNSMAELEDTYDKFLKGRQRAERLKKNSRFLPLFKKRGYANIAKKAGGTVIKRKTGRKIGTPKVKKIMPDDSFMKGLSQDAIDDILGRPKRDATGVKRSSKKKKGNTKVAMKRKAGGKVIKKMAGGSLKDTPAGNKGLPMLSKATRNTMGYKKAGGMVKKMGGGQVLKYKKGTGSKTIKGNMSGEGVVAGCYNNKIT